MIRTNLATRPFYNERAVRGWVVGLALAVFAATLFNVLSVVGYNRSDAALAATASADEARARELQRDAARLRATVDPKQIDVASNEARAANELIDRRTFSWTDLFNRFEKTLPDEARITSVRPRVDPKRGIVLTVTLAARTVEDVDRFMQNLEDTGAFRELNPSEDRPDEEGLINAVIEAVYKPNATPSGPQPQGAPKP